MKSYVKFKWRHSLAYFTIIIAAAVICLSIVSCSSGGGGGGNNSKNDDSNEWDNSIGDTFEYYVNDKSPPSAPQTFADITAKQLVEGIRIGWSLGNRFDAYESSWNLSTSISTMERYWTSASSVTTKANIDAIKKAGFNAIRIPVTWMKAAGTAPDYTIRTDWMERVTEVVNYAAKNNMYIIIDTHHDEARKNDNGSADNTNTLFKFTAAEKAQGIEAYKKMWGQIAENFKNYNERLVFEGLNEPRIIGASNEWNGGTAEVRGIINEYYEAFVATVRASGGNNAKRILMIPTHGAHSGQAAMDGLVIPSDPIGGGNKIIVSIHAYVPNAFALNFHGTDSWSNSGSNATDITTPLDRAYSTFVSKGIPVIMGEFGAVDKANEETRANWAKFYVTQAKSKGIPCFWWDNRIHRGNYPSWQTYESELFGIFESNNNTFPFPKIIAALMEASQ